MKSKCTIHQTKLDFDTYINNTNSCLSPLANGRPAAHPLRAQESVDQSASRTAAADDPLHQSEGRTENLEAEKRSLHGKLDFLIPVSMEGGEFVCVIHF